MKKHIFILLLFTLLGFNANGQIEEGKYYHYRTDHYYDTLIYDSRWDYFAFLKDRAYTKGTLQVKEGIDQNYDHDILNGKGDSLEIREYDPFSKVQYPYTLIKKNDTIFIKFLHYHYNRDTIIPMYPLKKGEIFERVVSMGYFQNRRSGKWVSRKGDMSYLSDSVITILDQPTDCHVFMHTDRSKGADKRFGYDKTIFLEKKTLTPVKTITQMSRLRSDELVKTYWIEYIDSVSVTPPLYKGYDEILNVYDRKLTWTEAQFNEFKRTCLPWATEQECDCIYSKIEGKVNFFVTVLPFGNHCGSYQRRLFSDAIRACDKK